MRSSFTPAQTGRDRRPLAPRAPRKGASARSFSMLTSTRLSLLVTGSFALTACLETGATNEPESQSSLGSAQQALGQAQASEDPAAGSADWPSAGHDWAHSGHNPGERVLGLDTVAGLAPLWQHHFEVAEGNGVPVIASAVTA